MPGVGLNATLFMGTRSLATQRTALEVVGHNLANVNTPGAARQRVRIETDYAFSSPFGNQGTGTRVAGIESVRNALLDAAVLRTQSNTGFFSQRGSLGSLLEQTLGENFATSQVSTSPGVSSLTGLQNSLNTFFDAWQSLASDPTATVARHEVLTRAQTLAGDLRGAAARVLEAKQDLVPAASGTADAINGLATELASLNREISRAEVATGQPANDLRDRRQLVLEELARQVNVTVTPNAGNSSMLDVALADNPAIVLVQGVAGGGAGGPQGEVSFALSVSAASRGAGNPPLTITATPSTGTAVTLPASAPAGGELGGILSVASQIIGDGAGPGDTTLLGRLNRLAVTLRDSVNTLHGPAWRPDGTAGGNFFGGTGAGDFVVALTSGSQIAAAGGGGFPGALDGSTATAIAGLRTASGLGAYHRDTVASLGLTVQQAQRDVRAQGLVSQQIFREREAVSGISIDEEMTSLVSFQRAYEASARFINVINEMLQTVTSLGR